MEEAAPNNVFMFLLLSGGVQVQSGGKLPWSEDIAWAIVFEPGRTETETLEDVDYAAVTPPKYLVYTQQTAEALRQGTNRDVPVHEVFADKVLLATRMAAANAVLEEIKESLGGLDALKAAAENRPAVAAPAV